MTFAVALLALLAGFAAGLAYSRARAAALRTALDYERASAAEKIALLERSESALSQRVFEANSKQFLELARETLTTQTTRAEGDLAKHEQAVAALVGPIREELAKIDAHSRDLEAKREGAYRALVEQVSHARTASDQLRTETAA